MKREAPDTTEKTAEDSTKAEAAGNSQGSGSPPDTGTAGGTPPPAGDLLRSSSPVKTVTAAKGKPIKNAPYAVDRLVMQCAFCHGRDTKRADGDKRKPGKGFIWAHCNTCDRDFKVVVSAPAKKP